MRAGRQPLGWRVCWTLLLAITVASGKIAAPSIAQSPPTLSRSALPATGQQASLLTISRFGRYAVTASSAQGTGLQLVDRSAGPGDVQGIPGKTDGRLDVFLDRGEYRIVTHGHDKGSGEATLAVHTFRELNAPQPPMLVELKAVDTTLDDYEQRSYWLEITERRRVFFEAAGRNLADLRLWGRGEWMLDATPTTDVVNPQPGRPLLVCRLAATLDPGFYLLTAYGGVSEPWAVNSPEHPFHLRFGIPKLGPAGRSRRTMGPFGIDRWLVSGANYYRIELPEARPATLEVGSFDEQHPFEPQDASTTRIDKNALAPVAEESYGHTWAGTHLITVTASAGQPYVLQHFDGGEHFRGGHFFRLGEQGTYWVSTVHAGDPTDSIDATALIMRRPRWRPEEGPIEPFASQVVELGAGQTWAHRCNLLEPLTLFMHIQNAGKYEVLARRGDVKFRIEPFMVYEPPHYQAPERRGSGSVWDLDAGYYVLRIEPEKQGIADVAIRPAGATTDVFAERIGTNRAAELKLLHTAAQFPAVVIDHDYLYTLFVNDQADVKVGMVLRRLPLDLTEPLPVTQRPGEGVTVPFTIDEPGTLQAEAEDGSLLPVSVDRGAPQTSQTVKPGEHRLSVQHTGDTPLRYSLVVAPRHLRAGTPLPPLPDPSRATPPMLKVLTEDAPQRLDLDRHANATFLIHADAPALYRLQSTGLLSTEGKLRTRTITTFDSAAANGVGHNFFLEQYLRPGDYQITVSALGYTKGHLGLTLERAQLDDGGTLTPGIAAHVTLPAGGAVAYTFVITEAGTYRLRSIGMGTTFRMRLEDAEGWPIERPNVPADLGRRFQPGTYRVISLPEPVASRRITLLERVAEPAQITGHGPHPLPLGKNIAHVWMEPDVGAERLPDTWEFALPAPVDAHIDLTNEMQGTLALLGEDERLTPIATLPPARGWKGTLPAGRYRLQTMCARADNRHAYFVGVWPDQLVAGLDRSVTAPVSVPISVGRAGLVTLSSFGKADVRARLYDDRDRLIASNDDGPDDWNFHIQSRLAAGSYHLKIDPVTLQSPKMLVPLPTPTPPNYSYQPDDEVVDDAAAGRTPTETPVAAAAACEIRMRAPQEIDAAPLPVPTATNVTLSEVPQLYLLTLGEHAALLLVSAQSPEGVGVAIETAGGDPDAAWQTLGSAAGRTAHLEMPLRQPPPRYRLRLWSMDGRTTTVHLAAVAVTPQPATERDLERGVALAPVAGIAPRSGVVAVQLGRHGVFRLQNEMGKIRVCAVPDVPCETPANGLVSAGQSLLWMVGDVGRTGATVAAKRVTLESGVDPVQIDVAAGRPVACDVAVQPNAPVVVIASSRSGQPGVRLADRSDPTGVSPNGQGMAVDRGAALAVSLNAAQPAAVVWATDDKADAIAVRLRQLAFVPPAPAQALWEGGEAVLAGISARAFNLPRGPKRLRLAAQPGVIAVLSEGERITSVHWRDDEPFEETVETAADRLTLLHTRAAEDRFHADVLPLAATDVAAPLAVGRPFERGELRAGVLRLAVAAAEMDPARPRTLHVRTADVHQTTPPTLVTAAGRIVRGNDLLLDATDATLSVQHGPGLVLAWIDRRGEEAQDLWGAPALAAKIPALPSVVPLSGPVQALHLDPTDAVMLHVRTAMPTVTLLKRGNTAPEVEIHPTGTLLDAYLTGPTDLGLRAIGGASLTGSAEISTSPVTPIGEGLGPEILLTAGSTHLFSFAVTHEGPVGIGVRANPDIVECALLDGSGTRLGSGVVQMPTLKPGTYFLALHATPATGPVPAQPALAGVALPSTGPPEDVVRNYLKLATAPVPEPTPPAVTDEGTD